jgi:hypothetical protein
VTPQRLILLCNAKGVDLKKVSAGTGERWSPDDAALACGVYVQGGEVYELDRCSEYAYRYRWAGDDSVRSALRAYLFDVAIDLKNYERWPNTIKRLDHETKQFKDAPYLADLVDLAVMEEQHWFVFKALDLWSTWMGVQPAVWTKTLSKRYEAIRFYLHIWCSNAHHHIGRRLHDSAA